MSHERDSGITERDCDITEIDAVCFHSRVTSNAPQQPRLRAPKGTGGFRPLPSLSRGEDASTSGSVSFESYARTALAMSDADVEKVLAHTPKLAGYDVTGAIAPKVDHLCQELGADVAPSQEGGSAQAGSSPYPWTGSNPACWLTDECRVNRGDVGAILAYKQLAGQVVGVNANLRPAMAFLVEELGMSPTAVARAVKRRPSILLMNVDDNLRARLDSTDSRLGLGEEAMRAVLAKIQKFLAFFVRGGQRGKDGGILRQGPRH